MSPYFPYWSRQLRLGSWLLAFVFVMLIFSSSQAQSGGQISGYVTDSSGAPMAGVKAKLYVTSGDGTWSYADVSYYYVRTDQNGYYHFDSIPAREVRVKFEPVFPLATDYYDNAETVESAQSIFLSEGQSIATAEKRLR